MQSHREGGRSSDRTMLGSMGGRTKMSWPTDNARVVDTRWAHTYDGYQRLASDPQALGDLLRPARDAYDRTREVPPWCGVDFLRGWAFYLARVDRFAGGGTLGDEWESVLEALRQHPSANGTTHHRSGSTGCLCRRSSARNRRCTGTATSWRPSRRAGSSRMWRL